MRGQVIKKDQIVLKEELANHENNKSNPHGVTKQQVGLGSLEDYGIATQAEAEAGTSNVKYTTPLRVKQAIDKLVPAASTSTAGKVQLNDNTNSTSITEAATANAVKKAYDLASSANRASAEVDAKLGNLTTLKTTTKASAVAAINELFQSASDGKNKLATALTGMGIDTSSSDTFDTMAANIESINTGNQIRAHLGETINKYDPVLITRGREGLPLTPVNKTSPAEVTPPQFRGTHAISLDSTTIFAPPNIYKRGGKGYEFIKDSELEEIGGFTYMAVSPDDQYVAISNNTTPFLHIFKKNGQTYEKLNVGITFPRWINGVFWTPDSNYLIFSFDSSPYIHMYKRNGDSFTRMANANVLPPTPAISALSHDGTYFVTGHYSSPYISFYKRVGDTITKLNNPSSLPSMSVTKIAWSYDNIYLAVASTEYPYINMYKRSGDTLTKLSNPSILPLSEVNSVSFSHDSNYLIVGCAQDTTYKGLMLYRRSGDTFTRISSIDPLNSGARAASFSPDGTYLFVLSDTLPYFNIYKRSGETYTLTNPNSAFSEMAMPRNGNAVGISSDDKYFYIGTSTFTGGEGLVGYRRDKERFTKLPRPTVPSGGVNSLRTVPNTDLIVLALDVNPFVQVYKRNSNDTLSSLGSPSVRPTSAINQLAVSPDGTTLVLPAGGSSSPALFYTRSGDSFVNITRPSGAYATKLAYAVNFSPKGTYLVFGHTDGTVSILKKSGSTYEQIDSSNVIGGTSLIYGIDWDEDETYLALAHSRSPYVALYKRSGDTFTALKNPVGTPSGPGYTVAFNKESNYLVVGTNTKPHYHLYKVENDTFTRVGTYDAGGNGKDAKWTSDGNYLFLGHWGPNLFDVFTYPSFKAVKGPGNADMTKFLNSGYALDGGNEGQIKLIQPYD